MSDYCSVVVESEQRPDSDATPLEQYQRRGYVHGDGDESKALDAAVALTASTWGPPMATSCDDADGEWWMEACFCAAEAVEQAIVDGVTA